MANDAPHSLRKQTADQIRNEQRGGQGPVTEPGPEASDTMREVWSKPDGEALGLRNAMIGAGGRSDDHSDLTAAETPETHKHLSDASLPPTGKGGQSAANPAETKDAIDRATSWNGQGPGEE